jgi:hypothetical protein
VGSLADVRPRLLRISFHSLPHSCFPLITSFLRNAFHRNVPCALALLSFIFVEGRGRVWLWVSRSSSHPIPSLVLDGSAFFHRSLSPRIEICALALLFHGRGEVPVR